MVYASVGKVHGATKMTHVVHPAPGRRGRRVRRRGQRRQVRRRSTSGSGGSSGSSAPTWIERILGTDLDRAAAGDELVALEAATTGRRGPGYAGSARIFPGESASPAAAFGPGLAMDVMPACPGLAVAADAAAGEDDSFAGVSDAELVGVLCA